jgi:probable metal-binding protein
VTQIEGDNMPEQIHGHEVMQMMNDAKIAYTRDTLRAAIVTKFGADARFYTCAAEDLTADELIDFLDERGKFVPSGAGFVVDADRVCRH